MNKPPIAETIEYLQAQRSKQTQPHQGYYDVAIEVLSHQLTWCKDCKYGLEEDKDCAFICSNYASKWFAETMVNVNSCDDFVRKVRTSNETN